MAVLSDSSILESIISGDIVINPFDRSNLKNTMYDLTLGEYYWKAVSTPFVNPYEKEYQSKSYELFKAEDLFNDGHKYILINPGDFLLCHTNEFAGTRSKYTSQLFTRSTLGRLGLRFSSCAGLGDVGFYNRWTLEVENVHKSSIYLRVGTPIVSIVFLEVSGKPIDDYSKRGFYSVKCSNNIEELISKWSPEKMLPNNL